MRRAVFLDRDGVLNRALVRDGKPYPPRSVAEVEILPGTRSALERLRAAGFLTIVVTNQPDVASGKQRREVVEAINAHLRAHLPIDAVKICYHLDQHGCECRKPKPGMLLQAASELGIDLAQSYLVGDRWRDIAAAQAAGCSAYFIDWKYSEKRPNEPYVAVKSLSDAADQILR
ncbi:MAG: HAD family hydrolase [Betaproteobacteria bacterium]|nr:MAG: HAD family hydrolase [Betaproteobacteria bacterium]